MGAKKSGVVLGRIENGVNRIETHCMILSKNNNNKNE